TRSRPPRSVIRRSPLGRNANAHGRSSEFVIVTTRTRVRSVATPGGGTRGVSARNRANARPSPASTAAEGIMTRVTCVATTLRPTRSARERASSVVLPGLASASLGQDQLTLPLGRAPSRAANARLIQLTNVDLAHQPSLTPVQSARGLRLASQSRP